MVGRGRHIVGLDGPLEHAADGADVRVDPGSNFPRFDHRLTHPAETRAEPATTSESHLTQSIQFNRKAPLPSEVGAVLTHVQYAAA